MSSVKSEDGAVYNTGHEDDYREKEDRILVHALTILSNRLRQPGVCIDSPDKTRQYLTLKLGTVEREVFGCMFMNTRNELVAYEELFYGTVDGAAVHPREVVKAAMRTSSRSRAPRFRRSAIRLA